MKTEFIDTIGAWEDIDEKEYFTMKRIEIDEADNYLNDFSVYIPDLIPAIEKIHGNWTGSYYDLLDKMQRELPQFKDWSADKLKHFNYNTNAFVRSKLAYEASESAKLSYFNDGYIELSSMNIDLLQESRKYVSVYSNKARKVIKAKLIKDAANTFFWVEPRFSKRGFHAFLNDLVKR